jgi:tryptophanyl-tRNA synthetase
VKVFRTIEPVNHQPPQLKRVLSGMRPTGKLHLGNYMGALYNWVRLQHDYSCYFFVADWHALTTDYADTTNVRQNTVDVALDWLAAGLDPDRCVLFVQSLVPQHAELHLLLSMIMPLGWLERVPTYKEQQLQMGEKDLTTYGFLGYPLLMATDILIYQADFVPVGQDQVAHVEVTREVARRFNHFYPAPDGAGAILPEPQVLLTPSPKLPGTDGRKMSKSYGNTILLTDPEQVVRQKLKTMVTDPARVRRSDPGDPDVCPVGDLHKVFSSPATLEKVYAGCRSAAIGCIECKGWAADAIVAELEPMQQRRRQYEEQPRLVHDILHRGSELARARAEETMEQVREAMHLVYPEDGERAQ